MTELYNVSIRLVSTKLTAANLQKIDQALNQVGEWLRFSGSTWLVWSSLTTADVSRAVASVLMKEDSFIVCRCHYTDFSGWAAEWIWNWLVERAKRNDPSIGLIPNPGLSPFSPPSQPPQPNALGGLFPPFPPPNNRR